MFEETFETTISNPLWLECVDLALEAIAAGSLGIGSIITTARGEIAGRGRNQLFDTEDSGNIVKNNPLSHAELNAIVSLPNEYRESRDLELYATVEPCPLCIGAIAMSRIRTVHIASRDPWAGSTRLLFEDQYLGSKNIKTTFETGVIEKTFFVLHLISIWIRFDPEQRETHRFFKTIATQYGHLFDLMSGLEADQNFRAALSAKDRDTVLRRIQEY